jgi:uncharacterized protein YgbK (DUF1537 family)
MGVLFGAVADDFTGATDLANTLVRNGMRTVQLTGMPADADPVPDADAIIVALKSRTIPAADAVAQSLAALDWLRRKAGVRQVLFKYCSTFDSTDAGNIGPVADAMLDALGGDFTIFCPAFPENGRTIYKGYLFVGDVLLSESGMRDHPLTPMRDPSLVRVLQRQTTRKVGLVPYPSVAKGRDAIAEAIAGLRKNGFHHAVVDAIADRDLAEIGAATKDLPLITGGSGIAIGIPENFRRAGLLAANPRADTLPTLPGMEAVISGSCSTATLAQVEHMRASRPVFEIDPLRLAKGEDQAGAALAFAKACLAEGPVLIYASAPPERVRDAQQRLGRERAGALVEEALAAVARGLVEAGVRRLVVAGGETAGAVVSALGVKALQIGPQIDPGVPWTASLGTPRLALALKSGNFGGPDFFTRALKCAP